MARTVLHILAQRPKLTGSGTTLDAFAMGAARSGWNQHAVVAIPKGGPFEVAGIEPSHVHPLLFENGALSFPVPGMSDVMPYVSTRFSDMTEDQLDVYKGAWKTHLQKVIAKTVPDVILSHHIWIVSSILKDVAPFIPVVTECHSTGLRQMDKCPHLAGDVIRGCARNDQFLVLRKDHAKELAERLGVESERIHVVGAGYNDALFHQRGRKTAKQPQLIYVGKLSHAKGLPQLLDALEILEARGSTTQLHVAGAGAGDESDALLARFEKSQNVHYHGRLEQDRVADLMRTCHGLILPSFYEGVPLVLVEGYACGCALVATELPGVVDELLPHLSDAIELVSLPRLTGADTPDPSDLPAFTANLVTAIERALLKGGQSCNRSEAAHFTWSAVFERVERVLNRACDP